MQAVLSCKLIWNRSDYFRSAGGAQQGISISLLRLMPCKKWPSGHAASVALVHQLVVLSLVYGL